MKLSYLNAILLLAFGANSAAASSPDAGGTPNEERPAYIEKEGRITVSRGLKGQVPQLTDAEQKTWVLSGTLRRELSRTGSHILKVWGTLAGKELTLPVIDVARYEIVSVSGRRPTVGTLWVNSEKELYIGPPDAALHVLAGKALDRKLRKYVNCKIWAVGSQSGTSIDIYKFGWLSCAKRHAPRSRKGSKK